MRSGAIGLNLSDSVYERLLAERIIFLGSQVDDDIANRLCAQILLLAAEDPTKDISLYINSPGGSISAGMAIYDTMVLAPCDVATYAMGMAASMGEFLLAAKPFVEDGVHPQLIVRAFRQACTLAVDTVKNMSSRCVHCTPLMCVLAAGKPIRCWLCC
jgi:hypothetical protein